MYIYKHFVEQSVLILHPIITLYVQNKKLNLVKSHRV